MTKPVIGHSEGGFFDEVLVSLKDPADIAAFKDDVEVKLAFLRAQNPVGAEIVKLHLQGKCYAQIAAIVGLSSTKTFSHFRQCMMLLEERFGIKWTPATAGGRPQKKAVANV